MSHKPHIAVCVCTYKRPALLARALEALGCQETDDRFAYSIVVVDNDRQRSAEPIVSEFADRSAIASKYCVEPRQNIALARNMAVANADGTFVAFIDDDEFPIPRWLTTLFDACIRFDADGVLGPVKPHFDQQPPRWLVAGRFYDRPTYPTGLVIDGKKGRTGNVLLRRHLFDEDPQPFRPQFLSGEDQDFFARMIGKGHLFVWCNEALAYEVVPPMRWKRRFILKRALLSGATAPLERTFGARHVVKSLIAVPLYLALLPLALLLGQGTFMTFMTKLCDHAGKLLAIAGIEPIDAPYVTE
jgi:glycosyltransferase involved in cell wall biosynthesis